MIVVAAALWDPRPWRHPKHQGEKESREGSGVKRSRGSPTATAKRGNTKDVGGGVAYAVITRRSEPDQIIDRRGEGTSGTANRRDRRNHEDASNDTASAPASRRTRSDRATDRRDNLNSMAMRRHDYDEWEMRRDGEFAGRRQVGERYRRHAHHRSGYRDRY